MTAAQRQRDRESEARKREVLVIFRPDNQPPHTLESMGIRRKVLEIRVTRYS
jgi:hypothetical protein